MSANGKKDVVLFVSAGHTDLQVLINEVYEDNTEKTTRCEVIKDGLRHFHNYLISDSSKYSVKNNLIERSKFFDLKWVNGSLEPVLRDDKHSSSVICDVINPIQIVPAKLIGVVSWLKNPRQYEREQGEYKSYYDCVLKKVVVFYTKRTDREDSKEPIAVGEILSKWISEEFGGIECEAVNILPLGRMESDGANPINENTVIIINDYIKNIACNNKYYCCMSAGGGMKDLQLFIKSCARFHFSEDRYFELEVKQERERPYFNNKYIPTNIDSFTARSHAISLIKHGDFFGAYGAVKHLSNNDNERDWITNLGNVVYYLEGTILGHVKITELVGYLKNLLPPPRCLLVAIRTEAALRSGRIPDAVSLSLTFLDAALYDAKDSLPPEHHIHKTWERESIVSQLGAVNIKELNDYYSATVVPADLNPRNLRNENVHQIISKERMQKVRDTFTENELWAKELKNEESALPEQGGCFLKQTLVHNVLVHFGVNNGSQRYVTLVSSLCEKLIDHPIR